MDGNAERKSVEPEGSQMQQWTAEHSPSNIYVIAVKGYLAEYWSEWLGGLHISHDGQGYSLLTGAIPDQAALFGILVQIRDLGLTLDSLARMGGNDDS